MTKVCKKYRLFRSVGNGKIARGASGRQSVAAHGNGELLMSIASRLFARLLSAFLVVAPLSAVYAVDQSTTPAQSAHHKSHKKPATFVLPPLPSGPLKQIPMDQLPAVAPRVTYQNGLLTIAAQNATLAEILHDVRNLTGASVDIPQGGGGERVVAQLGPGAPRDVLAQLLNGTSFNYVMAGSTSDPNAVATVVLTSKPSSGEVQTAANTPVNTFQQPDEPMGPGRMPPPQPFRQQMMGAQGQPQPPPQVQVATAEEDTSDEDNADEKDDESDQAQPVQPGMPIPQPDAGAVDPNQPNAGPKTPEQILQMMRQGQPGGPPNGAGPGPLNGPPPQPEHQ